MTGFIMVTVGDGEEIIVRVADIKEVDTIHEDACEMYLDEGRHFRVYESAKSVFAKIKEA